MGGIQNTPPEEIQAVIERAIENGVNFFDLCAGGSSVYEPFGRAIKGKRDKVYFQLHFGAVYKKNGEYGWSRNLQTIKNTFEWELKTLGTDYVDFGFLHCVDDESDLGDIKKNGILDFVKSLKNQGVVRHIGFSSHTPSVANKLLDTGIVDMMMFAINPAYDLERVRHWHDRRTRGTFPPLRKGRSGHIGYETFSRRTFRRTTEIPCVEQKRARLFCNRRIYAEICRR